MREVFIGSEALTSGVLTRGSLRWNYRAIYPDVYISKTRRRHLASHRRRVALVPARRSHRRVAPLPAHLHGASWVAR